jgi:hypothetical protein
MARNKKASISWLSFLRGSQDRSEIVVKLEVWLSGFSDVFALATMYAYHHRW